jgi:hypothetical protein
MRIFLFFLLITLAACNSNAPQPAAYNDSLAVQQILITEKANKLQDAFAGYVQAEMEIRRNDLENQLEKADRVVQSLGPFNKDEALLVASREFIEGYRQLNLSEYEEVIRILSKPDSSYSEADEARINILYKTIDEKSHRLIDNFLSAQREFAEKNQLMLKPASDTLAVQ